MKHIKRFGEMIVETLKSDKITIVEKKIDNFFQNMGWNKKLYFGHEVENSQYFINHDRKFFESQIRDCKNPENSLWPHMIEWAKTKSGMEKIKSKLDVALKNLEEFQYGDIYISWNENKPEILEKILHIVETVGYFPAKVCHTSADDKVTDKSKIYDVAKDWEQISLFIEPNYDSLVDCKEEYLYHTTDQKNLEKILKVGLVPKSKNTRSFYPGRIYLSPNVDWMQTIKDQLSKEKGGEWVKLKIKNFPGLKLYKDVRFKGGFYTYDNIKPEFIEVI